MRRSVVGLVHMEIGGQSPSATAEPRIRQCGRGGEIVVVGIELRPRGDDLVDAVEDTVTEHDFGPGQEVIELLRCPRPDDHRGDSRMGSDKSGGQVGQWELSEETSALSTFMLPSLGSSTYSPGTYNWGYLILGVSCAVAALSGIAIIVVPHRKESRIKGAMPLLCVIVIAALTMVVLVALEAHARPPFGDDPPLRFAWGAVVGVAAATLSLIGGCWALIVVTRSTTELDVT
jgi:hypothetical protein